MKDSMIYKNLEHKYLTLDEVIKENQTEEDNKAEAEEAVENDGADNQEQIGLSCPS